MRDVLANLFGLARLLDRVDRIRLMVLAVLMAVAGALEAASIVAIQVYLALALQTGEASLPVDALTRLVGPLEARPSLVVLSLALFAFFFLKNAYLIAFTFGQARYMATVKRKISNRLFRLHQFAPYAFHSQQKSSDLIRTVHSDVQEAVRSTLVPLLDLCLATLMALGIIAVLLSQAPWAALIALVVTALGLTIVASSLHRVLGRAGAAMRHATGAIFAAIQHGHGAFVDARLGKSEDYLAEKHAAYQRTFANAQTVRMTTQRSIPYFTETLAMLGLMVIVYMVIQSSRSLESAIPVVGMVLVATMRLRQLSARVALSVNDFSAGAPFIAGVLADVEALAPSEWPADKARRRGTRTLGFERLELTNIGFRYRPDGPPVLSGVSLTIEAGQSVALVGATGSGKSTVVSLILGLLAPDRGEVLVNGRHLGRVLDPWQDEIGYIPQHIFLHDRSIRENIAFGEAPHEIDDIRVAHAAASAALAGTIAALPDGLDTEVGERGVRLSGGERQRIGIARALYRNPSVLIMDEATSALDNSTAAEVMSAVNRARMGRTFIIVAHRLDTVRDCDAIYLLDGGKVAAAGSFDKLCDTSPAFRRLANIEEPALAV